MACKVISGDAGSGAQPVPWRIVDRSAPPARQGLPYSVPETRDPRTPDGAGELAQLRAKLATAEAEKDRQVKCNRSCRDLPRPSTRYRSLQRGCGRMPKQTWCSWRSPSPSGFSNVN